VKAHQNILTFHQVQQNLLGPLHVPYHHPEGAHPYLELEAHLSSCHHDHPCEKESKDKTVDTMIGINIL
jgi:hypothetical protein